MRPTLFVVFLALTVGGCAATGTPSAIGSSGSVGETETGGLVRLGEESKAVSMTIDATPDAVWAALPRVYERLGIATELNDATSRTMGTRVFTLTRIENKRVRDLVRCANQGSGPSMGGMYRIRLTIVTRVIAAGDKSTVLSEVGGSAAAVEGTSTGVVACASTGMLEQRIRELTLEVLGKA